MAALTSLIKLAFKYFSGVFFVAFVLGALRVIFVIPKIGAVAAVLIEIPIILIVSWLYFRYLLSKENTFYSHVDLFFVGFFSFLFLMITEYIFSIYFFHITAVQYFESMLTIHGLIGLLGQAAFASVPLWQQINKSK